MKDVVGEMLPKLIKFIKHWFPPNDDVRLHRYMMVPLMSDNDVRVFIKELYLVLLWVGRFFIPAHLNYLNEEQKLDIIKLHVLPHVMNHLFKEAMTHFKRVNFVRQAEQIGLDFIKVMKYYYSTSVLIEAMKLYRPLYLFPYKEVIFYAAQFSGVNMYAIRTEYEEFFNYNLGILGVVKHVEADSSTPE